MRTEAEIRAELEPLMEQVTKLHQELHACIEAARKSKMDTLFADGITIEGIMSLNWEDVTGEWYERVTKFLRGIPGTYASGYMAHTGQANIQIMLDQNKPLDEQLGIKQVIPFIKAVKGWKVVSIFEHTLSARASYCLVINEEKGIYAITTHRSLHEGTVRDNQPTYGMWTPHKTLDDAFQYIYENLPYEKKGGCRDYDDDYDADGFGGSW